MAKRDAAKDSPNKTTVKADLYTIVKRRRRTVETYMAENGVTTKKQLDAFLKHLKITFSLSEQFKKECDVLFKSPIVAKPSVVKPSQDDSTPP
jgi:hypothetical protein